MPKFRKKPIVIEATQWEGSNESWNKIMAMGDVQWRPGVMGSDTFSLKTLSGWVLVRKGYWVIKGIEGEFYPCAANIFKDTYDLVEEGE